MSKLSRLWIPVVVLAPAVLVAQERRPIRDNQEDRPGAQAQRPGFQAERPGAATRPAPSAQLDHQLVSCLIIDNEGEIELAKFAQQRAQSKEVKDFAEQMINDHGEFLSKLQQIQRGAAADDSTQRGAGSERRRGDETLPARRPAGQSEPARAADAAGERGAKQNVMLQIKKEIAERCLASIQRELEQKKGADFDRCYMGTQQMAHMKMVDELAVFEKYASPELQKTLAQGSQTARTHLTHAKTLLAKLEGTSASETARRPSTEKK